MYTTLADETCVVPEQRGGVAAALLAQVSAMGDDELTVRARELAGEISAAEANLAAVVAEIERREIHSSWECRDIVRFAGWHLQQSPTRARALAEVGRAMENLPVVAEGVADGTLSFDKARSIVKVAMPETEGVLVQLALHATVAQEPCAPSASTPGPSTRPTRTTRAGSPAATRTDPSRSSPPPSGGRWACCASPNAPPPRFPRACDGPGSTPPSSSTSASTPSMAPTSPPPAPALTSDQNGTAVVTR